ncbi:hypothetical protein BaRGS_00019621 [Batillaria attramentaria]|uniref:Uncharacterized protein n=1 Tax=Batillaria attramentaria TaxID=370345 RepID=A0ABD0KPJ7_9CAEN
MFWAFCCSCLNRDRFLRNALKIAISAQGRVKGRPALAACLPGLASVPGFGPPIFDYSIQLPHVPFWFTGLPVAGGPWGGLWRSLPNRPARLKKEKQQLRRGLEPTWAAVYRQRS